MKIIESVYYLIDCIFYTTAVFLGFKSKSPVYYGLISIHLVLIMLASIFITLTTGVFLNMSPNAARQSKKYYYQLIILWLFTLLDFSLVFNLPMILQLCLTLPGIFYRGFLIIYK